MRREAVVHELERLYDLTRHLRRECPWDRKQTQEDIVAYTLEETYELVDTVRHRATRGDAAVCGELGDLLFQVYFLASVAEDEGLYDLADVAAGIYAKLVRRHPHIFGEASAETPDEVRKNWDAIKRESEGREGIFHDVPAAFPSTLLAQKLQQRAAAVGFDWENAADVLAKVKEETGELERELMPAGEQAALGVRPTEPDRATGIDQPARVCDQGASYDQEKVAAELGDLLFSVVNLSRKLKVDPELALRHSALRFRDRVEAAAGAAGADGLVFEEMGLEEQEAYYQQAKKEQGR
jgi:tetrapyrrole methylase family protein / MazG family protein